MLFRLKMANIFIGKNPVYIKAGLYGLIVLHFFTTPDSFARFRRLA